MKDECSCIDPRSAGVALMRWGLGFLFLLAGLGKFQNISGFVHGFIMPTFANTIIPEKLLLAYGYTLPFVEVLLGASLLLGIMRNPVLFVSGLTFISLAFGQMLLRKPDVIVQLLTYLFMAAVLLFLDKYDTWTLGCCCRSHKTCDDDANKCS
jgi:thiosulfate dehydrogenase [quinone] large subunit